MAIRPGPHAACAAGRGKKSGLSAARRTLDMQARSAMNGPSLRLVLVYGNVRFTSSCPAADVPYRLLTGGHWPNHWLLPHVFISEWLVSEKETQIMKKILRFGSDGNGRLRRSPNENTAAASQRTRAFPSPYELSPGPGASRRTGRRPPPVAAVCAHGNVILRVNSDVTLGLVAVPNTG